MTNQPLTFVEKLSKTKLVITDVDGVLTDGKLYYGRDGEFLKPFHVRDGFGFKMLKKMGIKTAIVSGRSSDSLYNRIRELDVNYAETQVFNKGACVKRIIDSLGIDPNETVCIGDDIIDIPMFEVCGISYVPNDAPQYMKTEAKRILESKGGYGAFREVVDEIVQSRSLPFTYFV